MEVKFSNDYALCPLAPKSSSGRQQNMHQEITKLTQERYSVSELCIFFYYILVYITAIPRLSL